jgi:integrase
MATPATTTTVRTAVGIKTIESALTSERFDDEKVPPRIRPFLQVARVVIGAIPQSSARGILAVHKSLQSFIRWGGVDPETVKPSPEWLISYVVARCCPPVDAELPEDEAFRKPVLPTTAIGDLDELRRGARIGVVGLSKWSEALAADTITAFAKEIGGRVKKLRTNKRPFLFRKVQEAWDRWGPKGSGAEKSIKGITDLRNAVTLVIGFFYGSRAGELVALTYGDIQLAADRVRVTFRSRKTLRSVLGTHQAQTITAAHDLLLEAVSTWMKCLKDLGAVASTPLFPTFRKSKMTNVAIAPATVRFLCKAIDPLCVAHSLRAGMATEAWAAGVPLDAIMALGGWASPVAVLYIVGSTDETVEASRRLGTAGMRYEGESLRATLGTSRLQRTIWSTQ